MHSNPASATSPSIAPLSCRAASGSVRSVRLARGESTSTSCELGTAHDQDLLEGVKITHGMIIALVKFSLLSASIIAAGCSSRNLATATTMSGVPRTKHQANFSPSGYRIVHSFSFPGSRSMESCGSNTVISHDASSS
jgi:hypothetical protein